MLNNTQVRNTVPAVRTQVRQTGLDEGCIDYIVIAEHFPCLHFRSLPNVLSKSEVPGARRAAELVGVV